MTWLIVSVVVWFLFVLLTYGLSYGFFSKNYASTEQQKGIHCKMLALAIFGPLSFLAYLIAIGFDGFRCGLKFR